MHSDTILYTEEVRLAMLLNFFSLLLYMYMLNMLITFPYKLSSLFCFATLYNYTCTMSLEYQCTSSVPPRNKGESHKA